MGVEVYHITPVAAPRMTQRDSWLNPPRKCVAKYFAYRDRVRKEGVQIAQSGTHIRFVMPMAKSWSATKKAAHFKKPHKQVPDIDNLLKALLDSVFKNDFQIHSLSVEKVWGYDGAIVIKQE